MSKNIVAQKAGKAGAKRKSNKKPKQENYEPPETVKVGKAQEVTQGNSTKNLDGYYGPGWTRWW